MQKLIAVALPSRFEIKDLKGWSVSDLRKLSLSSEIVNDNSKNVAFRSKHSVTGVLRPSERQLIMTAIAALGKKELASVSNVQQHYMDKEPTWFSVKGIEGHTPMRADAWVVPPHLESSKPAVPQVIGMLLALTDVTSEGEMTAKESFAPLLPFAYENLNVSGMAAAAPVMTTLVEKELQSYGKVQGGRDLVDKLYDTVSGLAPEEFLLLHYVISCGPFVDHFNWGKMTTETTKNRETKKKTVKTVIVPLNPKTPGFVPGEVIISVKAQFNDYWTDFSECPTAKMMRKRGDKLSKIFVWSKGMTPSFLTPTLQSLTFAKAYKYMNECRNFRGTDEKGLSGWSCGFGASGNPTKLQTRLNRKLALILGAMLLKKKMVL